MIRKFIKGVIVSLIIVMLPVLCNVEIFYFPQVWILFILGISASVLQPNYNIVKHKLDTKDKGTEIQIIWSVYITQLFAVLEAGYLRFPDSVKWDIFTTISLIIMILGLALRTWAIYSLGMYFTMHLSIQENHKIMRKGPYKYLRHPGYAGAFFTYLGTTVFLHAWFSLIATAVILPIAWLRRINYEEKLLAEELGEEYKSYCNAVKRVIPWLW